MSESPDQPAKKPRRTVLMTAGLTASASVIAASILGAQASRDEATAAPDTSSVQYAAPLVEDPTETD